MLNMKPYICRTHCSFSISDLSFPLPISVIHVNSRIPSPITLRLPSLTIACTKRRGWSQPSNRTILHLVSTIAFNLKILPEPFNSIAGEIACGDYDTLSRFINGRRGKIAGKWKARKKKLVWFAFVLICIGGGLWSWRIQEFDLFLRVLLLCLAVISLIRLRLEKKAVREWFVGFLFGIVLILSSKLGGKDLKFWVQKISSSQVMQIVRSKRNRNRNWRIFK